MKMKRGISISILLILALAGAGADDRAIRLPSDGKAGEGKQKPWGDCCDIGICTLKYPPSCQCMDKVKYCSSACKDCEQVPYFRPTRYVCRDWYHFGVGEAPFEIPRCTEAKQKPWGDCCDMAICNRKLPPGCSCRDRVESCSSACKDCVQVSDDPPRYVCQDWYDFDLDDWNQFGIPKCTE